MVISSRGSFNANFACRDAAIAGSVQIVVGNNAAVGSAHVSAVGDSPVTGAERVHAVLQIAAKISDSPGGHGSGIHAGDPHEKCRLDFRN